MTDGMLLDSAWRQQPRYEEAETVYQLSLSGASPTAAKPVERARKTSEKQVSSSSSIINDIAQTRQQIKKALDTPVPVSCSPSAASSDPKVMSRLTSLENENKELRSTTTDLQALVKQLGSRVAALELRGESTSSEKLQEPEVTKPDDDEDDDDDDDDIDLFGSDDEDDDEAEKLRQERLDAYADKKSQKPVLIAKSNIILDVKPWGDDTDMVALEKSVRSVTVDGLLWGASKLVAVGYGIKKLQISCVVEDDKVGTDILEEEITAFDEYVQSVDIAAFNKV